MSFISNIFENGLIPRFAALSTVGFMAYVVDPTGSNFWWLIPCFVAISLVLEFLSYRAGVVEGMYIYRNLSPQDKKKIEEIFKEIDNE